MLERILLDANAVLNASFVPQSWSRLVVAQLAKSRTALFAGSFSLREAVMAARKTARELGKRSDPAAVIEEFIRLFGVIEVPPSSDTVEADIPKHDRHVVLEAATAGATILTSDAQLWAGCQTAGRMAVLPLQALQALNGISLATTVFGEAPKKTRGSLFARVWPGNWAGRKEVGRFTVADYPGRLWLYYCTHSQSWIVEMPEVGRLNIAAEISQTTMQTVAVSWEVDKHLRLRIASIENPAEIRMRRPLQDDLRESVYIGIRGDDSDSWFGNIRVCVVNDGPIGKALWATLKAPSELTPNPYDSDRLRQAINNTVR
jgi:predicted nucleic acid-binding protein